jgi:hypothetical protein
MSQTTDIVPAPPQVTTEPKPLVRVRGRQRAPRGRLTTRAQIVLQIVCLVITLTVLFPILYIFALAIDPRNLSRPDSLIPPGASLDAFARVIAQPTSDEISLSSWPGTASCLLRVSRCSRS